MLRTVKRELVVELMVATKLVELQWEVILDNKTKEPSTSLVGIEEAIRIQEGTGSPMGQMEENCRGRDQIMEASMGDQTSIQTVRLHKIDGEH